MLVTADVGNIAVAVTPVKLLPSPLNEPVKLPVKNVPAWVVVIDWLVPTSTPKLAVTAANSACEPDTMTFFQVAIYVLN